MAFTSSVASSPWSMTGSVASLPTRHGRVELDVAEAARGLAVPAGAPACDRLLGVDVDALADHWVRGGDVVATYEPHDPRRLRATVLWRSHAAHDGVTAWEAIVSAQTSLAAVDVDLAVRSDVAADHLAWSSAATPGPWHRLGAATPLPATATAILARRADSSCLIAVHPADARGLRAGLTAGRGSIDCDLFAASVEKGVLLRSRVVAAIGPALGDESWAEQLLAAFAASPPPLDT